MEIRESWDRIKFRILCNMHPRFIVWYQVWRPIIRLYILPLPWSLDLLIRVTFQLSRSKIILHSRLRMWWSDKKLRGHHSISRGGGWGVGEYLSNFCYWFQPDSVAIENFKFYLMFIKNSSWKKIFILCRVCPTLFISKIALPLEIKWWPPYVVVCLKG